MKKPIAFGSLLLLSTALVAPAAVAQTADSTQSSPPASATPAATAEQPQEEEVDISAPGASNDEEIVVMGRFIPEPVRATPEVVSVLSSADIARTGEGDIAGALQRVTGLSVVGNGFVFVRGLGDRYSLALLNGSPLPSPEPLRRVVPLDIFPTSVIASSVVQKSYSVNYPGEFGGGVINLTTKAVPNEPFLSIGFSGSGDTETTAKLGYTYYGSDLDVFGFDDGARNFPSGLSSVMKAGTFNATSASQRRDFAASLTNAETTLLQRNSDIPMNFSADITAGASTDLSDGKIGFIAAIGYKNDWRTRDVLQQTSLDPELAGIPQQSFQNIITDNRIVVNGMLGIGVEFGDHKLRWTNLYIRDTLKQGRLASGYNRSIADPEAGLPNPVLEQNTYWFERQLIDTQFVGEFKFGDLSVDLRGTYANSQRESPYERSIGYTYLGDGNPATKGIRDVDDYVNNLSNGGQFSTVGFSDLNEDVYAGGIDLAYKLPGAMPITLSAGYNYNKTKRSASRYLFQYFSPDGPLSLGVSQERPDYLLSDYNIYTYNIQLRDVSGAEGAAAYTADLKVHAGYGQAEAELTDGVRATLGVRYEDAVQTVQTIGSVIAPTSLSNSYWLPAATLTWNFAEDMQLRVHASKTIARPQFRELAPQIYQDFESDREFTGNPFLKDSELTNAEARYEYYFGRGERVTFAGFYKKIKNPIEAAAYFAGGGQLRTGFANAPEAQLYGAELEVQKYVPLEGLGGDFFSTRRLVLIGNYTYTKSKLKVDGSTVVGPDLQPVAANLLFRNGAPLAGQSDHLGNIQIGIEDTDKISQATLLLTYASKRVSNRGPIQGDKSQPDIIEKPGFRVDFVVREELDFLGVPVELKMEARNLTAQKSEEYQQFGDNRIDINTYRVGRSFSLGATVKF
jgi:TonB-dependent receptor